MIVEGIPSGDLECWCFLVDKGTFKRVKGKNPDRRWDVGRFAEEGSKYRYMLYPHDLIGWDMKGKVIEVKVEVREKKLV